MGKYKILKYKGINVGGGETLFFHIKKYLFLKNENF